MTTVAEYFTDKIAGQIQQNQDASLEINEIYQFNITGEQAGCYTVGLKDDLGVAEGENDAATCVITIADEDFIGLMTGEKNGMELFTTGKIQIDKDLMAAMKLEKLFTLGSD
jgi:putative sterol carrier protein